MITRRELRDSIYKIKEEHKKNEAIKELNFKLNKIIINNNSFTVNVSNLTEEEKYFVNWSVYKKHNGYYYTRVAYEKEYPFSLISERKYEEYNIPKQHQKKFEKLQGIVNIL